MRVLSLIAAVWLAAPVHAGPVDLSTGWEPLEFSGRVPNRFVTAPDGISVESEAAVSMIYAPVGAQDRGTARAAWTWTVDEGVPPTDLTQKGGDDRNLSLYFLFLPPDRAEKLAGKASLTRLLRDRKARVLVYVRGGDHSEGEVLQSPYLGKRGVSIIKRGVGDGTFTENVDLRADYRAAFGDDPVELVGLALSADSDDTNSRIVARIGDLRLD